MTFKEKLRITSLVMFLAIALPVSSSNVTPGSSTTNSSAKNDDARSGKLLQRLEEIRGLDKSELTRLERKSLRKEVTGIKKDMKAMSGGIYLSVGAVIIIILLLILLL